MRRDNHDRHVDQEDQTPAQSADIGGDESAAQKLADGRGEAEGDTVNAERASALMRRKQGMHGCQRLRGHRGCGQRLQQPRHNEREWRVGETAQCGSRGEAGKTDQEDGLAPINIAKPSAGDEKDRIDHGVARNDELRVRRRGLQIRRDRWHRDNDDEEVEQRQKRTYQQTRERPPPPWIDILDLVRRR